MNVSMSIGAVFSAVRFSSSSNSQCAVTVAACNSTPVEGKLGLDNGPFSERSFAERTQIPLASMAHTRQKRARLRRLAR